MVNPSDRDLRKNNRKEKGGLEEEEGGREGGGRAETREGREQEHQVQDTQMYVSFSALEISSSE